MSQHQPKSKLEIAIIGGVVVLAAGIISFMSYKAGQKEPCDPNIEKITKTEQPSKKENLPSFEEKYPTLYNLVKKYNGEVKVGTNPEISFGENVRVPEEITTYLFKQKEKNNIDFNISFVFIDSNNLTKGGTETITINDKNVSGSIKGGW